MIGIYLSAHPLDDYEFEIRELGNITTEELRYFDKWKDNYENKTDPTKSKLRTYVPTEDEPNPEEWIATHEGVRLRMGGIITKVEIRMGKGDKPFGIYTLEDYYGAYEFRLFDDDYVNLSPLLIKDAYVMLSGEIQQRGMGRPYFKPRPYKDASYQLHLQAVMPLPDVQEQMVESLVIQMPVNNIDGVFNEMLKQMLDDQAAEYQHILKDSKGINRGKIRWPQARLKFLLFDSMGKNIVHFTSQQYQVNITPALYNWLRNMRDQNILRFSVSMR